MPLETADGRQAKTDIKWRDQKTVSTNPFPFRDAISIKIKQKIINKQSILANGLIESYQEAPYEEVELHFVPE